MPAISNMFDWLLLPLQERNPWWGMLLLSLMAGVIALLLVKIASNPARVRQCRDRALSRLLELWLYRHEPVMQVRAMAGVTSDIRRYVFALVLPVIVGLPPMIVILAQAHDYFNGRPLHPGEAVMVEACFSDSQALMSNDGIHLALPDAFEPDPPRVRAPGLKAVAWRLAVTENAVPGRYALDLRLPGDDRPMIKQVVIGNGLRRISPRRVSELGAHIVYPGEPRIPSGSSLESVSVRYPPPALRLGRFDMNGMWTFLVLTLLWGLALKRPLNVEI